MYIIVQYNLYWKGRAVNQVLICDLSVLHKYGKQALDCHLKPLGFNWQEMVVLMALERKPDADQALLSKLLQTDKANVTRLVSSMENKGLLVRTVCKEDSRRRDIRLTREGAARLPDLHGAMAEWEAFCYGGLSREQIRQYEEMNARIIGNIMNGSK